VDSQTLAGAPAGRNTSVGISFDRTAPPARFDIWFHESGGFDAADPQKWGRNTLTCQSRTDTTNGACMNSPVWFSANPAAPMPSIYVYACPHQQDGGYQGVWRSLHVYQQ
jgi:hypothetical protein